MDNEREKREPTDAEKALFDRIVDGMLYKGGVIEELSVPKAAFRTWCLAVIMQYTDWLRPEPTAGDTEAAEELARKFWELAQELLGTRPDISHNAVIESMAIDIAAGLSAARGDEKKKITREAACKIDFLMGECRRHFESIIVFMQDVIYTIHGNEEAAEDIKLPLAEYHVKRERDVALEDAEAKVKAMEGAAGEFFEAEELEYAAEMRTCPKATIGEINEVRDRRKLARDALAALVNPPKAEEVEK